MRDIFETREGGESVGKCYTIMHVKCYIICTQENIYKYRESNRICKVATLERNMGEK